MPTYPDSQPPAPSDLLGPSPPHKAWPMRTPPAPHRVAWRPKPSIGWLIVSGLVTAGNLFVTSILGLLFFYWSTPVPAGYWLVLLFLTAALIGCLVVQRTGDQPLRIATGIMLAAANLPALVFWGYTTVWLLVPLIFFAATIFGIYATIHHARAMTAWEDSFHSKPPPKKRNIAIPRDDEIETSGSWDEAKPGQARP